MHQFAQASPAGPAGQYGTVNIISCRVPGHRLLSLSNLFTSIKKSVALDFFFFFFICCSKFYILHFDILWKFTAFQQNQIRVTAKISQISFHYFYFLFFYLDFHNNGITYEQMGILEMFFFKLKSYAYMVFKNSSCFPY